jgi:hypothetical protein
MGASIMTETIVEPGPIPKEDAPTSPVVVVDIKPELLGAYKRMLTYQFSGALLLMAILTLSLLTSYFIAKAWQPPILVLVALSGMLGAFFSALTRLYNVDQVSIALISPVASKLSGWHLMMYSFVPPMVGIIASVVLYVGFISRLVDGGVFPKMSCKGDGKTCTELLEVMNDFGPATANDYGKALIWAFIAGFSERLVPDILQSLVVRSQKGETN